MTDERWSAVVKCNKLVEIWQLRGAVIERDAPLWLARPLGYLRVHPNSPERQYVFFVSSSIVKLLALCLYRGCDWEKCCVTEQQAANYWER